MLGQQLKGLRLKHIKSRPVHFISKVTMTSYRSQLSWQDISFTDHNSEPGKEKMDLAECPHKTLKWTVNYNYVYVSGCFSYNYLDIVLPQYQNDDLMMPA